MRFKESKPSYIARWIISGFSIILWVSRGKTLSTKCMAHGILWTQNFLWRNSKEMITVSCEYTYHIYARYALCKKRGIDPKLTIWFKDLGEVTTTEYHALPFHNHVLNFWKPLSTYKGSKFKNLTYFFQYSHFFI